MDKAPAVPAGVAETNRSSSTPLHYLVSCALLAMAYWVAARLSLNLALVHGQVTPIWPPTGIALVGFMVLGRRVWPAIALAAFAVNLPLGPSPAGAAVIAAGNTLAPLLSAELLARASFRLDLDRLRDAVAIVVLGALIGMTLSATVGTAVLTISGAVPMTNLLATWTVWWTGDAMGVLIVAPFLLSLWPRKNVKRLGWRRRIELVSLLAAVGGVTYLLFQNHLRLEYLVFPLIMAAAWRFRLRGAAPAALIASSVAIWAAVNSDGPFAAETLLQKMITLQVFNVSVSLASFVLASFVDTREQNLDLSRRYESAKLAIAAKTDAISLAARDLNAPAAMLSSYLAVLSDGDLGPPPYKWAPALNVMAHKAWQLNAMLEDLMDAARIESNAVPSHRAKVDLREVVKKAVDRAKIRADNTGAQIVATIGTDPLHVNADARQLGRILDNVLTNGLTFNARQPRLNVTAVAVNQEAVVRIADNGVGLSRNERDRIFEPFYRISDPSFSGVHGPGLGLYIGRQLAESNGGRLVVESTAPGHGTELALVLPLARPARFRKPWRRAESSMRSGARRP